MAFPSLADDIDIYTSHLGADKKPNILFVLDYSGSMDYDVDQNDSPLDEDLKINILKSTMVEVLDSNINRINAGVGSLYGHTTTGIRFPISDLSADAHTIDSNIAPGAFTARDIVVKQIEERRANGLTVTVDALVEAAQYFQGGDVTHNDDPDVFDDDDYDPGDGNGEISRYKPHSWDAGLGGYAGGHSKAALASTYTPLNAYSELHTGTFYCNDYSVSAGPNFCAGKVLSNCTSATTTDPITEGYENLYNHWGDYSQCEYERSSDWVGAKYNSPITGSCQSNAIVLISDGQPTKLNDGDSLRSVLGTDASGCEDLGLTVFSTSDSEYQDKGNCGPEILSLLANNNQIPGVDGSHVNTYTVGFDISGNGEDYLKLLAESGNGAYFDAGNSEELSEALSTIFDDIVVGTESFVSLTIDVDRAGFAHGNRTFFNLFTPSSRSGWGGNLKGYFFDGTDFTDTQGNLATVMTDEGLKFDDSAQSFWSSQSDGNEVESGGANEQIISETRNLYTYIGAAVPSIGVDLSVSTQTVLSKDNTDITHSLMGLSSGSSVRDSALDWIQDAPMGDPLHSKSVTVNYGTETVVFVMTNQGLIHAIDATAPVLAGDSSGGSELFAFMPRRLLANLPTLSKGMRSDSHVYGLDGSITRWHDDDNNDGVVNNSERVLLVFGMRRGGNAYYALDVSSPRAPKLMWVIDDTNPDFPELAQSWSRMSLISVNDSGVEKKVLAFAAGYDAAIQDVATGPTESDGNAIYMVDDNGNFVWSADSLDNSEMKYSIASDLTVIDSDSDGAADRLYVGDVAGNIWRVDFVDVGVSPDVNLFAKLDDGTHQPIFYAPSVALNRSSTGTYLSVSVGTGNRTNPLLTNSKNNIYMLRDMDVDAGAPATTTSTITPGDLYDATANDLGSSDTLKSTPARSALELARGWLVSLADDEKALSKLVTFEGKILATTFEAVTADTSDSCGVGTIGRYYQMGVETAEPDTDVLASSRTTTVGQRSTVLAGFGIPSSPTVIFAGNGGEAQVVVGKETVAELELEIRSIFWHAK